MSAPDTTKARPLYIFDLDGTLANINHRRHMVEGGRKDWTGFYRSCVDDKPNSPVIDTMNRLRLTSEILIFSGRSNEVRKETIEWLSQNTSFLSHDLDDSVLRMRQDGDYTPDDDLKREWFESMIHSDRSRVVAVFDDRDKVVKMWRDLGVACFQVASGDF